MGEQKASKSCKGTESLPQTPIYNPYIVCNLMVETFDISNLCYVMEQNLQFEISKVYDIGIQRYRDQKIRVCGKDLFIEKLRKKATTTITDYRSKLLMKSNATDLQSVYILKFVFQKQKKLNFF